MENEGETKRIEDEILNPALQEEAVELLEMKNGKRENKEIETNPKDRDLRDKLQNSGYCTTILLTTVICTVPMINYGLTCLNPAIPVLQTIYNETYYSRNGEYLPAAQWQTLKALTMSMIVAGAFIGSLSVKFILMFLSRKQLMVALHGVNIVGSLIICLGSGLTGSYEALIIGRFIMGYANGLALGIVPVIIGETCVKHRCAFYDGLIGVCLAIGALVGVILGWSQMFGTATLWPLIIATAAIPSFLYLVISPWIVDTPFYVMRHEGREEAQKILDQLRNGSETAISEEVNHIAGSGKRNSLLENEESNNTNIIKDATFMEIIHNTQYRRQFIMVLLLFANLMLNGLNNILFFSDQIFLKAGIKADYVTVVTVCVFLFQVLSTLPGSVILHRFGSWKLCIIGNIIMVIGHVLLVASLATYKSIPEMSYLAIVGVAIYLLGFAGGENIAIFPLVGELTTEVTRPICINFGCATLWFTGWLVGFMATYFEIWLGAYSFLIWMAFTIFFTIYIFVCVPNTCNKTSEEIQQFFKR